MKKGSTLFLLAVLALIMFSVPSFADSVDEATDAMQEGKGMMDKGQDAMDKGQDTMDKSQGVMDQGKKNDEDEGRSGYGSNNYLCSG